MSKYFTNYKLKGKHKRFDEKLYKKYDIRAREKIKNKLGDYVKDHPNQYKQDLIILDTDSYYKYLEIQVCSGWTTEKYPHDNVFVYERKSLYDGNTLYLTLNNILTEGLLFDRDSLGEKPRRLRKNSREFVYDILWNMILPIHIGTLSKQTIKSYWILKGQYTKPNKVYKKYNIKARKKIKKLLGDYVIDNPNPYKQDFIIIDPDSYYKYLEIQVCNQWINQQYPYSNVYVDIWKSLYGSDTLYLILNNKLTQGLLFDRDSFSKKSQRLKKYSKKFVYNIPRNKILPIYLKHLNKKIIKMY